MAITIGAAKAILLVFIACCTNVVLMEHLIQLVVSEYVMYYIYVISIIVIVFFVFRNDSGAGNLVSFLEYLFIVVEGFIFTTRCGCSSLRIPMRAYYPVVVMLFLVSVCSNYALQLSIPMPLYMVFSSGSLVVNMVMSMVILRISYSMSKYLAVMMITIGIILFTVISAIDMVRHAKISICIVICIYIDVFFTEG